MKNLKGKLITGRAVMSYDLPMRKTDPDFKPGERKMRQDKLKKKRRE